MYLLAILDSPDGIDLAEFAIHDARNPDGCYRLYDYQWPWFASDDTYQIDMGGRNCGKTESIKLRALAFPTYHAGKQMLLTAPELNHLRPLTDEVERILLNTRIVRELMPKEKSAGIARQPHWQCRFRNGSAILSRLPNKDGKGVKGCVAGSKVVNTSGADDDPGMLIPGALILTKRGLIPVEHVVVGDEVLTHRNRWRPVTATFHSADAPTVEVAGAGHRGLLMSESHSMLARRSRNPARKVQLDDPVWVTPACEQSSEEFTKRWYFGSPTEIAPVELPWFPHRDAESLLRLAGAFVADGHRQRDTIMITDHESQMPRLAAIADALGVSHGVYDHATVGNAAKRFFIHESGTGRQLAQWIIEEFGVLAAGKRLPVWLLSAPESLRKAFLDEYLAGDGHWDAVKGRWTISTASKELAIGLRLLGQSLEYNCNYSWVDPKVTAIMGVALKKTPQRSHRVTLAVSGRNAVVEEGVSWQKIRSVEPGPDCDVYDLAVEEDHSYIADGLISHNQHVVNLEMDESQDYPQAGWREVVETLNAGDKDAMWRCHGVSRGVRDAFFEKTQSGSGWKVHRPMAMNRPSWSKEERDAKIVEYGGSRQSVDYRRNIYGEHGDASNSVFVLAKLMAVVDLDEGSTYNNDIYSCTKIEYERFPNGASDSERAAMLYGWLQIPGEHFHGYSQRVDKNREVGAPRGYSSYWGGMDVGVTNHPSEILIFGQRTGTEDLELLTRVQMHRINVDDQMLVVERLFEIYGMRLRLGIDKTGVGFPLWDQLTRRSCGANIYGFGFAEKRVAAIEDRPLMAGETIQDLAKMRNVVEASTDWLRNDYVDTKRLRLPYDREVLIEFQGQTYTVVRDNGDPYGVRRQFAGGSFHCVDESTEILTAYGWRRYDQVAAGDDVLTLDMEAGASRWSAIDEMSIYQGPEVMMRSKTAAHDSLTTANHRWPARRYDCRTSSYGELKWRTTETLTPLDGVPITVPYSAAPAEAVYTDSFVELMAWFWTEGNCTASNTVITQSSLSENNVEAIRDALTKEFGPAGFLPEGLWHEYWSGSTCYFVLSMKAGCLLRSLAPGRIVRPEFLRALTQEQLQLFIQTSERGDGNHHPNSERRAFQHLRDIAQADMLAMACALAGIGTTTHTYAREASRSGTSTTVTLVTKAFVRPGKTLTPEPYNGIVWCPRTRDGNWLARRNGTVYWTGNTLDAAKVAIATKNIPPLEAMLEARPVQGPVFDAFMGA